MAELQQELQTKNKFDILVQSLQEKLGPTSGINSDDVDPGELQELMAAYDSNYAEWKKYDWKDKEECYTRNLVDKGNGKSNLVRLSIFFMKVLH
jgi:cysteine dioxygenase